MKLIFGLILIAIGIAIFRYRYQVLSITGNWGWAELYIGSTMNAIVLIGMACIMVGTAYPLGAFDGMMEPRSPISIEKK